MSAVIHPAASPARRARPRSTERDLRRRQAKQRAHLPVGVRSSRCVIARAVDDPDVRAAHHLVPARSDDIKTSGWWTFFANPGVTLENYRDGPVRRRRRRSATYFVNSFVITIPAVIIPISLAPLAAYAFAWIDVPGPRPPVRRGLRAADRADPGHADPAAAALRQAAHLSGTVLDGLDLALDLRAAAGDLPAAQLHEGDPRASSIEAARVDGAGHVRIFFRVMLPLIVPAIARSGSSSSCGSGTTCWSRSSSPAQPDDRAAHRSRSRPSPAAAGSPGTCSPRARSSR